MCLTYKLPYIPYAGTFTIGQAFRCHATWFFFFCPLIFNVFPHTLNNSRENNKTHSGCLEGVCSCEHVLTRGVLIIISRPILVTRVEWAKTDQEREMFLAN